MPSVRITRRIVDPITFCESVALEFLPRGIEDSILDATIGMAYTLPPSELSSLKDEELLVATNLVARPPSPPIPASPGGKSPRKSPRQRRKVTIMESSQDTMGSRSLNDDTSPAGKRSPRKSPRKGKKVTIMDISKEDTTTLDLSLDDDASINSEEDLGGYKPPADDVKSRGVRFADEVDINDYSRFRASVFDDLFYASTDLAEFRYEAFMEEAGLDIADYD
jgi:hypothetical protein